MRISHAYPARSAAFVALAGALLALSFFAATQGAADRYLPHGVCYAWQPSLIRLHLVSDTLIGLAYLAIPIALVHFIRARADLPFNWMFLLFGLFIVTCGATHWMEVWTLWNPSYWLAGSVKAITAAASVPTAVLLFMLIPKAVALPSMAQLAAAKSALEREVEQRRQAEAALEESHRQLERRVEERTAELRAANEQLERQRAKVAQADRVKGDFLAILSHELRNPVHAIRMSAWLLKAPGRGEPRERAAAAIERQVGKLSALLEELLDVVRVSRKLKLKCETADLRAIVDAAIETTCPDLVARQQALTVEAGDAAVHVHADASRLEQAIVNVLNNASKYTPQGGSIDVRVTADGGHAAIVIRDTGDGIAPEDLPHLFQLFGRGSASHTRSEGLGVGLYIAHELVVAHGGAIVAHSAGGGRGSEFVIELPIASAPATAAMVTHEANTATSHRGMRLLVVDDNRDAADALGQMLAQAGHDVDVCYEGKAAIRLAQERQPEVALIDIGLPTISGYDVARELAGNGHAPVMVAVTGWGAPEDKAKAFAAGFAQHLTKPIDADLLLVLLGEIAKLRRGP